MSVWFSASAVVPQLTLEWGLDRGQQSWLTMTVQAGFVAWHAIEDPLNCYTPNNVVGGVWESPNSVKFIRLRFVFWREN